MSPEQLSYLQDRGLSEAQAMELFSRAIVDDAANTLPGAAPAAVVSWARAALGPDAADEIADALELGDHPLAGQASAAAPAPSSTTESEA